MKPGTQERHHPNSSPAIILSVVLDRHRGFPIEVRDAFERQRPLGDYPRSDGIIVAEAAVAAALSGSLRRSCLISVTRE